MKDIFIFLFLIPNLLNAQSSKQDSLWKPVKFLIGNWQGTGDGEPGKGNYERNYEFIFNSKFIEIKNKSTYPTSGEVHHDVGYISYDKSRKTFVLRQFHIEGFVNQYKLDSISTDGKTLIFISEAIENIAAGWKARETYQFVNDNKFTETFELAPPNGKFGLYTKTEFKRIK